METKKLAVAAKVDAPSITAVERMLGQFISAAYTGLLAHREPFDESQSEDFYLDQAAYAGYELWHRLKKLCKEHRAVETFEENIKK
jgi:hypothetical protein